MCHVSRQTLVPGGRPVWRQFDAIRASGEPLAPASRGGDATGCPVPGFSGLSSSPEGGLGRGLEARTHDKWEPYVSVVQLSSCEPTRYTPWTDELTATDGQHNSHAT